MAYYYVFESVCACAYVDSDDGLLLILLTLDNSRNSCIVLALGRRVPCRARIQIFSGVQSVNWIKQLNIKIDFSVN